MRTLVAKEGKDFKSISYFDGEKVHGDDVYFYNQKYDYIFLFGEFSEEEKKILESMVGDKKKITEIR